MKRSIAKDIQDERKKLRDMDVLLEELQKYFLKVQEKVDVKFRSPSVNWFVIMMWFVVGIAAGFFLGANWSEIAALISNFF